MLKSSCILAAIALLLSVPLAVIAGPTHEIVAAFDAQPQNPSRGPMVLASDGWYWGTTTSGGAFGNGAIIKVKSDGSDWRNVCSFTNNGATNKGRAPNGGLVSDGLGFLWGTTREGGTNTFGTVYKIEVSTGVLTTVVNFQNNTTVKGKNPVCTLVLAGGSLWGTTQAGGGLDQGTIFKVDAATGALTTLVELTGASGANLGGMPFGALVPDGAGAVWGTTSLGGAANLGTIYRVNIATGVMTTVAQLTSVTGTNPEAGLVSDGLGNLWGTAPLGGSLSFGTLFKINTATNAVTTVVDFTDNGATNKGRNPTGELVKDAAGKLWGLTTNGPGVGGYGTLYSIDATAGAGSTITTAFNFTHTTGTRRGAFPKSRLVVAPDGALIGTTPSGGMILAGTVFRYLPSANTFATLLDFDVNPHSIRGMSPYGGLVAETADKLWTTSQNGGAKLRGTVNHLNLATGAVAAPVEFVGTVSPLASSTGALPYNGLVSDGLGFFWGTTQTGGAVTGARGTIFKVNAATGALTTVVNFTGTSGTNKGDGPLGGLILDGGFMWGVTVRGGASNFGTIYRIPISAGANATVTTMVEFTGNSGANRGAFPHSTLVKDGAGFFWGTTQRGGVAETDGSLGKGTIFKLSATATAGTPVTTMVDFLNVAPAIGAYPVAGLVSDGAGNLWGSTQEGGALTWGTLFKIAESATAGAGVTTMVEFARTGATNRGAAPYAPMIRDGNFLWGTTNLGGNSLLGTVFKVDTTAASNPLTTVLDFAGTGTQANAGSGPGYGALLKHTDGNFYGTTSAGGPGGGGTVYRLRMGPSPFTQAASGLTSTSATLNGTINPNGNVTAVSFEWGTSPLLVGATTVSVGSSTAGTTPESFSLPITGLTPGTVYYYRIVGTNAENPIAQKGLIRVINAAPVVTLTGASPVVVEAGASYTDAGATAQDPEDGVLAPTVFSNTVNTATPGSYSVVWRASDSGGMLGSATRTVNVVDTTAPVVTPPANLTVEATAPGGAIATFAATANDFVGVTSITYSKNPGTVFPIATTTVNITARDAANNAGTGSFTVTVRDTTAPVVTPPANITVEPTSPAGAVVSYSGVTATDAVGVTSTTYSQASGTTFPIGTTTVTVTSRDAANNTGVATFSITVNPLSPINNWRYANFGTVQNTGNAADTADPDKDGVSNLLEFSLTGNPQNSDVQPVNVVKQPGALVYYYVRSKEAVNAGIAFLVEWNTAPVATGWSTMGVAQFVDSENASVQNMRAVVQFPGASEGFVRLRVVR